MRLLLIAGYYCGNIFFPLWFPWVDAHCQRANVTILLELY